MTVSQNARFDTRQLYEWNTLDQTLNPVQKNDGIEMINDGKRYCFWILATRQIQPGEEIFVNYGNGNAKYWNRVEQFHRETNRHV